MGEIRRSGIRRRNIYLSSVSRSSSLAINPMVPLSSPSTTRAINSFSMIWIYVAMAGVFIIGVATYCFSLALWTVRTRYGNTANAFYTCIVVCGCVVLMRSYIRFLGFLKADRINQSLQHTGIIAVILSVAGLIYWKVLRRIPSKPLRRGRSACRL